MSMESSIMGLALMAAGDEGPGDREAEHAIFAFIHAKIEEEIRAAMLGLPMPPRIRRGAPGLRVPRVGR